MLKCDPLPDAENGQMGALLTNHLQVAHLYHLCAQMHADLVDLVRTTQPK